MASNTYLVWIESDDETVKDAVRIEAMEPEWAVEKRFDDDFELQIHMEDERTVCARLADDESAPVHRFTITGEPDIQWHIQETDDHDN